MKVIGDFGRYLWKFFVGDLFQLGGLIVSFLIVGLFARPLGAAAGLLAFLLVMAVIWIDVFRRAAAGQKW